MLYFHFGAAGPAETNWYFIGNSETKQAFVVDAPPGSFDAICQMAQSTGTVVSDILLTHTHWDHTADCVPLAKHFGARVSVHANDAYRLLDPMDHTIWQLPFTIEGMVPDRLLNHDQIIEPAGVMLRVLHTPGHSEGGLCFVDDEHQRVFVGDTLFFGSVGRTDLPGGDMEILMISIKTQLLELPDNFEVYPGHGPSTTIRQERLTNPFVGEQS